MSKVAFIAVALLLSTGCTTVKVITSDDFYYGCINGVYTDRVLSGQLDPNNPRMKETSLMCLMVEQKYKERVRQQIQGKPEREVGGGRNRL